MARVTPLVSSVAVACAGCAAAAVLLQLSGTAAAAAPPVEPEQLQQLTGAVPASGPGPLEQRARPVSAENPIPSRVHYVAPWYPPEAAAIDAAASVVLRLTLDALGRVGEVRVGHFLLGTSNAVVAPASPAMPAVLASLAASARAAAAQWIYEPPVAAPLSFEVAIRFTAEGDAVAGEPSAAREAHTAGAALDPAAWNAPGAADLPPWFDGAVPVSYLLKAPIRTRHVAPVYPDAALQARIEGMVLLQARIEADGTIRHARVLRSIPALDQAALDAILQWEFAPSLRDGQPVPVIMLVTVQFAL
jgi:periplasmic protein TonB